VSRIEKIKISLGRNHLKSRLKNFRRKTQFYNFDSAKTAGILFCCTDEKSFDAIREFAAFLKSNNVTVTALGYYPGKTIPDKFLLHSNINFFSNNDLNWYYKPKNTSLNKFINQKIDLFFDLSINNYFPVDFVSLLSNASFKVGMEKKDNVDFDLMINIDKNKTIPYLIEQIKHYLMLINKS